MNALIPYTQQQQLAIASPHELPLLVIAGAGSGKTTVLIARTIHLVRVARVPPFKILILVFTNKARDEAKDRLKQQNVKGVQVMTFHAFGMRMVSSKYTLLGYEKRPKVLASDRDAKKIKDLVTQSYLTVKITEILLEPACKYLNIPLAGSTWDTVADELLTQDPDLYNQCWEDAMGAIQDSCADLPDSDDDEEDEGGDAAALEAPSQVLPSQSQPQNPSSQPSATLSPAPCHGVTPSSASAAGPLPQPDLELPPPGTPLSSLKFPHWLAVVKAIFKGLEQTRAGPGTARIAALNELRFVYPLPADSDPFKVKGEIERLHLFIKSAKSRGNQPGQYQGLYQAVYEEYNRKLHAMHFVDFADMLMLCLKLFREEPDVLSELRHRHEYILIDEVQDLNPLQIAVTSQLDGERGKITAVGDDNQSIYGFLNSAPWVMDAIRSLYVPLNPQMDVFLTHNHRSTQNILDVGRLVLGPDQERELVAASRIAGEPVTIIECGTEVDEAIWIRKKIQELHSKGVPFNQIAILYRMRRVYGSGQWVYEAIQQELAKYNIPTKGLRDHAVLKKLVYKDIRAYMKLALNPHDNFSFMEVVNRPRRGFGDKAQEILKQFKKDSFERKSYYDCVKPLINSGKLQNAQAIGLNKFMRVILKLRRAALALDPVRFVYYTMVTATKYVHWAEALNSRANPVEDEPDKPFFKSDDEEESYDFSNDSSSSDDEEWHSDDGDAEEAVDGANSAVQRRRSSRKRPREDDEVASPPMPASAAAPPADVPAHNNNIVPAWQDPGFRGDDDHDLYGSMSEDEELNEDLATMGIEVDSDMSLEERRKTDPLFKYNLDLSMFRRTSRPLLLLLRHAAVFTNRYGFGENAAEHNYLEHDVGPPSLRRLCWKQLCRSARDSETVEELWKQQKLHDFAARLVLGPLPLHDIVQETFHDLDDGKSILDKDNVVHGTIHAAKGLEWECVFIPRFVKMHYPLDYFVNGNGPTPAPPTEPLIPGYEPPAVENPAREHYLEEARLCHVAVTRAKMHLFISMPRCVKGKTFSGVESTKVENPSNYVKDLLERFRGREARQQRRDKVLDVIRLPQSQDEIMRNSGGKRVWVDSNHGILPHPHPVWELLEEGNGENGGAAVGN